MNHPDLTEVKMLPGAAIELAPYLLVAALCMGILITYILRADASRKSLEKELAGHKPELPGKAPYKVSAGFLVAVTISFFLAFALISAFTVVENIRMRQTIRLQEDAIRKKSIEGRRAEKESALYRAQMEEMSAQKALYTATIETLMKREDASRLTHQTK